MARWMSHSRLRAYYLIAATKIFMFNMVVKPVLKKLGDKHEMDTPVFC